MVSMNPVGCDIQMIITLHTAFEYLARVAVFVEQARIGENLAINENVSFEDEFRQLEDDHEAGLYWLLCALHRVIFVTGTTISQDASYCYYYHYKYYYNQPGSDRRRDGNADDGGRPQCTAAHARLHSTEGLRASAGTSCH